jgi:hypothetical protein
MQFFPEEKTFRNRRFVFQTFYFLLLVNGVIFFVIKSGFLRVLPISSTNKTDHHDITEILLKVLLKHHNLNPLWLDQYLHNHTT